MNQFLIVTNRTKDKDLAVTNEILRYLESKNASCFIHSESEDLPLAKIPQGIQCAIVLGGDGTILRAAGFLVERKIPILGVNMGNVGFLAEIELQELTEALDALLEDRFQIEERMMLRGRVYSKENEKTIFEDISVNDIAICRSGFSRIIELQIFVNDKLVDVYGADGVVVSTPTGSTGYNLSAGGPVVNPRTHAIIVTPISPHSLNSRSIVLSDEDRIVIKIGRLRKTQNEEAFATFDGQDGISLNEGDAVEIYKSHSTTRLIKINDISFFDILRSKIGGKDWKGKGDESKETGENY